MPLDGLRVLSLESRRAREMETLIRRQGGEPFVAPSVKERATDEQQQAFDFIDRLQAGEFDLVICMTGAGLTFLNDVVAARVTQAGLVDALSRVTIVSRGPKPAAVLRQWGVPIGMVIPEPNTWREVVAAVIARAESRIALQEYGRPNPEMVAALEAAGRRVSSFAIYRWDLPEDLDPLKEAARRIAARECDVVLFTSSVQLDHLLHVAESLHLRNEILAALPYLVVVSIGPIMNEALAALGLEPDIVPEHPKMGALVKAASDLAPELIASKAQSLRGRSCQPS